MAVPKSLRQSCYPIARKHTVRMLQLSHHVGNDCCDAFLLVNYVLDAFERNLHDVIELCLDATLEVHAKIVPDYGYQNQVAKHQQGRYICHCQFHWSIFNQRLKKMSQKALKNINFDSLSILTRYGYLSKLGLSDVFPGLVNQACSKDSIFCDVDRFCFALEKLCSEYAFDLNSKDESGNNIVHYSLREQRIGKDLLEVLISKGVSVNEINIHGRIPLHEVAVILVAVSADSLITSRQQYQSSLCAKCDVLLNHGADMNMLNRAKSTPLVMAIDYSRIGMMAYQLDFIHLLIRHGAYVNCMETAKEVAAIAEKYDFDVTVKRFYTILFNAGFRFGLLDQLDDNMHVKNRHCDCSRCKGIRPFRIHVPSLLGISRYAIRTELQFVFQGFSILKAIDRLEIPTLLKAYLKMDLGDENDEMSSLTALTGTTFMKSLVELSLPIAEEFVLNSLCEKDDSHSCEWKRLLPVLSHAFQHHLDTVLEFCLDIMPKIAKKSLVDAYIESIDHSLSMVDNGGGSFTIDDDSFQAPIYCENCDRQWIETSKSVTEYAPKAVAGGLKFPCLRVLDKHGFLPAEFTVDDVFSGFDKRAQAGETTPQLCAALDTMVDEFGFDVNTENGKRERFVHFITGWNKLDGRFLEHLISKGAEINVQDYRNSTPLHALADHALALFPPTKKNPTNGLLRKLAVDKCRVFLKNGANMTLTKWQQTPLDLALSNGFRTARNGHTGEPIDFLEHQLRLIEVFVAHGSLLDQKWLTFRIARYVNVIDFNPSIDRLQSLLFATDFDFAYFAQQWAQLHIPKKQFHNDNGCKKCEGLAPYMNNPRPLVALSRLAVRKVFSSRRPGLSIQADIERLPAHEVPALMKSYLKMEWN